MFSHHGKIKIKERAFDKLWDNNDPSAVICEFLKIAKNKILSYKKENVDWDIDQKEFAQKIKETIKSEKIDKLKAVTNSPEIPAGVSLHDYQKEAIQEWKNNNYCGIFDMATGTGKTYNPIIGHSSSEQRDFKQRFKMAIMDYNLGVRNFFCFVCTNGTFATEYIQNQINNIRGNVLLVVDEAHNFGATNLKKTLIPKFNYRLALSATLERHGDEEGTQTLLNYFGK